MTQWNKSLTYNMRQTFAFTLHNDNSQLKRLLADEINMQLFSPRQCLCLLNKYHCQGARWVFFCSVVSGLNERQVTLQSDSDPIRLLFLSAFHPWAPPSPITQSQPEAVCFKSSGLQPAIPLSLTLLHKCVENKRLWTTKTISVHERCD